MSETNLFLRFGVALFIGVLVGLQREFAADQPDRDIAAGVRTFPLFCLTGCGAALISDHFGDPWVLCVVLLAVAGLLSVNYFVEAATGHIGLTTKMAAFLTVIAGALCYWDHLALAVALGVTVMALLSAKIPLHTFAHRLTRDDIYATVKFAVISAIVLPVLPDRAFGPGVFAIFNPFKIWLFVVFISAISFVGYVLVKVAGSEKGVELTGLLGGLASSTAVTLSFAGKSKQNPGLSRAFALAITIAWTVMFGRVVVAVAVLNLALAAKIWLPLSCPIVAGLLYCAYLWRRERIEEGGHQVKIANPFELGLAIKFGVLFAVILFVSKAAQVYWGSTGIYLSGFFSGLADVDAISLSMAKLSRDAGGIDLSIAARATVIAAVANSLLKGGVVLVGGSPALRKSILPGFLLIVGTAVGSLLLL